MESQPQNPELKVSLKILNSGLILKTFTHVKLLKYIQIFKNIMENGVFAPLEQMLH